MIDSVVQPNTETRPLMQWVPTDSHLPYEGRMCLWWLPNIGFSIIGERIGEEIEDDSFERASVWVASHWCYILAPLGVPHVSEPYRDDNR